MPKKVKIELPVDFDDDDVKAYFCANVEDLHPAMDLDVGQSEDSRLEVDDIDIEEIELDATSIHIEYTVEFSAYYGCDDANFSDIDHRVVEGVRVGNSFIFDEHVYPEPRNTVDEF